MTMAQSSPRVLVIAESANPEQASVSLEGWSLSHALLEHVEAHIVTHVRNRDALERAGWREGREYTAIDPGAVETPVNRFGALVQKVVKLGWTWTTALGTAVYYHYERLVWQRFGERIRRGDFDIVHRMTPVSPATPSPIAGHCTRARVPFVWGPINGGVPWPKGFHHALRGEGEWLSYVRGGHRLLPGYRRTRSAAAALITGSINTFEQMNGHHERCVYVPENAIDPDRFAVPEPEKKDGPLRIVFVGRLVPYKGADMLIDAVAPLVRSGQAVLDIIGDGQEMTLLRRQIAEAQIARGVTFHGWVDHREVARLLARSQVFAFPSIREFGGAVVLEAMALGLVPVVVNNGGPGELVTDQTGFRVPLGSRESIVAAFREILTALAASPERARLIGSKARRRVYNQFTWDVKARQILEVYRWVLGKRDKPDFGMPLPDDSA